MVVGESEGTLDESVHVSQEHGFLCHVTVTTKLDLPPAQSFEIISDPDNARIFRNIEECSYRKVMHDDGRGRKRVTVHHQSGWRFMWHHGRFVTELLVEQDDKARVMAFRLAKPGFMKNFEGFWRMQPFPGQPEATLAVLHQNVLPCVSAPGLNWVFTKICKAQIEAMLEDVKKEVSRIQKGDPVPKDQEEKMKGKRSWREPTVRALTSKPPDNICWHAQESNTQRGEPFPQYQGFSLELDDSDADSPRASTSQANGSVAAAAAASLPQQPNAAVSPEHAAAAAATPATRPDQWELLSAAEHDMVYTSPEEQPRSGDPPASAS